MLSRIAACLPLWSCGDDLIVGEDRCSGAGVVCDAHAPLFHVDDTAAPFTEFDVVAVQSVPSDWARDVPCKGLCVGAQLAPAYDGGVWIVVGTGDESYVLHRFAADGEIADSQPLASYGTLTVDGYSDALITSWLDAAHPGYTRVNGRGDLSRHAFGALVGAANSLRELAPAPDGGLRVALVQQHGSFVAEYEELGDLRWQQSELRVSEYAFKMASDGPRTDSFLRLVPLTDGALAVVAPLNGEPSAPQAGAPTPLELGYGITLLEPDGNVRWHLYVGPPVSSVLAVPGVDGSVVLAAPNSPADVSIMRVDRNGTIAGRWTARQAGYYDQIVEDLACDPAGDIYTLGLGGERNAPLATLCRIRASDLDAAPLCVTVEGLTLDSGLALASDRSIRLVAPAAGSAVFSVEHLDPETRVRTTRLTRVAF
jgi:hypothetical protein